jgi:hypothetical protein
VTIQRFIFAFAGSVILASLALSHYHDPRWAWLTAFVGLNLFQTAFTGFCPLARILKAVGMKSSAA